MKDMAASILVVVIAVVEYLAVPALLVWGWVRWVQRPQPRTLSSILSLVGFVLATVSAVVAVSSICYARLIGGFPYYDPLLLRVFRIGGLLSLTALVSAIGGAWRPSALRWHALGCAVGTLLFWLTSAAGE